MKKGVLIDPFLSEILGKTSGRLTGIENVALLNPAGDDPSAGFVYAKISTGDTNLVVSLENAGFHLIDTNVQLDRPLTGEWPQANLSSDYQIRFAQPEDRQGVQSVAGSNFVFTRFHLDPKIPNKVADNIKASWAGNYFVGLRGEFMVVAMHEGRPIGFLQLVRDESNLVIDLVAVEKAHQGLGVGTSMIIFAVHNCDAARERILVGTQIANVPSLRAYAKIGFRVCTSEYVFHYHGSLVPFV